MRTTHRTSPFAKAPIFAEKLRRGETAGQGIPRRKVIGSAVHLTTMTDSLPSHNSNPRKKPSPHAVSKFAIRCSATSRRVALGSPPQSLGEDAQAECQETPRKPRKRLRPTRSRPRKTLRLTRSREKMDSGSACGFAPPPGDAGGGGAIYPR